MDLGRQRALRKLVLAFDGLAIIVAMLLAALLHAGLRRHLHFLREPPSFDQYAALPYLVLPLFLTMIGVLGLHRTFERLWTRAELLLALLKLHAVVFVCLAVLLFLTRSVINRSLTLLFLACTFGLLYLLRRLFGRWRRFQHSIGQGRLRLLLVGEHSPELQSFVEASTATSLPPFFVGRLGPAASGLPAPTAPASGAAMSQATVAPVVPCLGGLEEMDRILHEEAVDQVLFFPPSHRPGAVLAALELCERVGVPAHFAVEMPRLSLASPRIVTFAERPFIAFETAPKPAAALAVKHAFDAFVALAALVALSPVLLLAALAILVTMGRPILFVQERAGLFGRRFRMLKFRTMVLDAERQQQALQSRNEMSGPVFKIAQDPRITPLGRFLRRSSIDELPQLLNVLVGTMSLVGPRPLPVREQQGIRGWHRRRLSMKPGITGLWQVSGRSNLTFEEWMKLDLEYVDSWSLRLDGWILLQTLPAVVLSKGAH